LKIIKSKQKKAKESKSYFFSLTDSRKRYIIVMKHYNNYERNILFNRWEVTK